MPVARTILHVDMDAFFAAVEQRDRPELRGRPVLVGGTGRRGVVTTASYEARRFGCRSAMPMAQARRLCPAAVVVPGRMGVYSAVSRQVRAILERYTPDVEPLSIDEAFLDVTGSARLKGDGRSIAESIRREIRAELSLAASVGVAPNKFLAKVASDLAKPDGLRVIEPGRERQALDPLPVGVIFGIGPRAAERLAGAGIRRVADLAALGAEGARARFGEAGEQWHRLALGLDERPVRTGRSAQSIGKERTFGVDEADPVRLRGVLLAEVEAAARTLRREGLAARAVTVKLRRPDFSTHTRSRTLDGPSDRTADLFGAAGALLKAWLAERPGPLRLLGVSLHGLERRDAEPELFGPPPEAARQARLDAAADEIVRRFGHGAIGRAGAAAVRRASPTRSAAPGAAGDDEEDADA